MKKYNIVKSQPKLFNKNKLEIQPPTPNKFTKNSPKFTSPSFNRFNKENQNSKRGLIPHKRLQSQIQSNSYKIIQDSDKKFTNPSTTKASNSYSRNFMFSKEKQDKKTKTNMAFQMQSKKKIPINQIYLNDKTEAKKNSYQKVNDKVRQLEQKIKKIKEGIKKPEKKEQEKRIQSNRQQNTLSKYLTQFPPPQTLIQVSSQTNLITNNLIYKQKHQYYISTLILSIDEAYNQTSFMQLCKNHLLTSLQVLNYTKTINKPSSPKLSKCLPKTNKKTIVFDLDETLIHCNQSIQIPNDVVLQITFPNGESTSAGINIRTWATQCLRQLSNDYEIIIFTASHQCYANVVIDYIDPKRQYVSQRYFRDSCFRTAQGFYIKDLRVIDRPLQNILLVDNAAYSYAFQLQNGVPIIPFYDNKADNQLKYLVEYLKSMKGAKDLRKQNSKYMRINQYLNYNDATQLVESLYGEFR